MRPAPLPPTIGRYRVLGELAVGGMAEILLARIEGPGRFSRPVVLKRILPHLARQPEFVSMFLDEARIVAGIRHANVVQVHELSNDDGELFLVMEYIEGESASGLMKRLRVRGEELDPHQAAYVIAELCAGLHAAHELEDVGGVRQELVHRDVSPQNCIITYDGHVKLLDFGVALAADRVTRTQVGQVKGKLQYMSPEQCLDRPLDRRSDIFALGIVLYELMTGRLLFKRDSSAATVRAICDEPVVPPSRVMAECPAELEAICMRALAASPDERFATCAEMRSALLEVLHAHGGKDAVGAALTGLMRSLFDDRIAEKRELLRRVESGSPLASVPQGEVDVAVELPTVAGHASAKPAAGAPAPVTRQGSGGLRYLVGGITLVALGTIGWIAQRSTLPAPVQPTDVAPAPQAAAAPSPPAPSTAPPTAPPTARSTAPDPPPSEPRATPPTPEPKPASRTKRVRPAQKHKPVEEPAFHRFE